MYAIHTTPGFIIESRPSGEAGKLLSVFTRDLGLVRATAQGIRLEKSKLRYHAQEYSFGTFSFVRGKEYWRLTSAAQDTNLRTTRTPRITELELLARIALLLRRLLHGEEPHAELFDEIETALGLFDTSNEMTYEEFQTFESLLVFRIVRSLGYVGDDKGLDVNISSAPIDLGLVRSAMGQRKVLNAHINKALRESQL